MKNDKSSIIKEKLLQGVQGKKKEVEKIRS
jgi:hypothetical protein